MKNKPMGYSLLIDYIHCLLEKRCKMNKEINKWQASGILDDKMKSLLSDKKKVKNFFDGQIAFGTGGMRGLIGPGPNGINEVTIARVTAGLGDLLNRETESNASMKVVIGYDNRFYSRHFAEITASILSEKNIEVLIFGKLTPTPIVSYAIRQVHAQAGVMITASHNPKEYNGYKIYDETGCQLLPDKVEILNRYVEKYKETFDFTTSNQKITWLDQTLEESYVSEFSRYIAVTKKEIKIGYSPEQGTGGRVVKKLFDRYGFTQVWYPEEQWYPDPSFSNTKSPNPEDTSSFDLLIEYGKKFNLDLLLANDPDADRLGAFFRDTNGDFIRLTGNQIGALIFQYLIDFHDTKIVKNKYLVKTIVSSDLAKQMAITNGYQVEEVLTGFKYIGDTVNQKGPENFSFAFEESFGYLVNPIVRDKDGLQIALILSELANKLRKKESTLGDYLQRIYETYGYYEENTISIQLDHIQDVSKKEQLYSTLSSALNEKAIIFEDYQDQIRKNLKTGEESVLTLPKSMVQKFYFEDNSWVCIRPSGTEPKIKIYIGVFDYFKKEAVDKIKKITAYLNKKIEKFE